MAELEIHHEHEHSSDPLGQKVGVMASLLAVLLAVVTIASHREHTAAIIHKSGSNDQWAYYQATRVKLHSTRWARHGKPVGREGAERCQGLYRQKKYEAKARR
jgi:hypothetical protein